MHLVHAERLGDFDGAHIIVDGTGRAAGPQRPQAAGTLLAAKVLTSLPVNSSKVHADMAALSSSERGPAKTQ